VKRITEFTELYVFSAVINNTANINANAYENSHQFLYSPHFRYAYIFSGKKYFIANTHQDNTLFIKVFPLYKSAFLPQKTQKTAEKKN